MPMRISRACVASALRLHTYAQDPPWHSRVLPQAASRSRSVWIRLNAHRWCQQLERATVPAHADRAMECAWPTRAELLEPCEDEP